MEFLRDEACQLELGLESSSAAFPKLLDLPLSSLHLIQITLPLFLHPYAASFSFSKYFTTKSLLSYMWRLQYKACLKANTGVVLNFLRQLI